MSFRSRGSLLIRFFCLVPWLALSAGCGSTTPAAEDFGPLPRFTLTEQSGKPFRSDELDGKVWVSGFIFTRCAGPCPVVTGGMARLADAFVNEPDVRLVTITVDPEFDTPAVLNDYARRYSADPNRWVFLTGPQPDVYRLILKGFKLGVEHKAAGERPPGEEVTHTIKLAVVDRRGHLRGYFDGTDDAARSRLADTVRGLLKEAR